MTPAQMAPSTTPQNKVATKRQVLAKTILRVFFFKLNAYGKKFEKLN